MGREGAGGSGKLLGASGASRKKFSWRLMLLRLICDCNVRYYRHHLSRSPSLAQRSASHFCCIAVIVSWCLFFPSPTPTSFFAHLALFQRATEVDGSPLRATPPRLPLSVGVSATGLLAAAASLPSSHAGVWTASDCCAYRPPCLFSCQRFSFHRLLYSALPIAHHPLSDNFSLEAEE